MGLESIELQEMGSPDAARVIFERFYEGSNAYRNLIDRQGINTKYWKQLPLLTKKNFYDAHPWREIVPRESYKMIYSVLRSSGTSNKDGSSRGFFWPQLKNVDFLMGPKLQGLITEIFQLEKKKTLVIIGLSLGSWAGGEQFSYIFKTLAMSSPFPLVVFSPGNQHAEILEIIEKAHEEFDQILIALCPSAIFYLERLAAQKGTPLPLKKISFIVTGEPFPEDARMGLQARAQHDGSHLTMLSIYGAADTGMLGFESLALIRVRQYLAGNPELARKLGFTSRSIPNLYHAQLEETYLENVDDELVITRWQGVPLVRYNLQDRTRFLNWKGLCRAIADNDETNRKFWEQICTMDLPDVIAIAGRSQGCVFLCGSNIFESMLQEVVLRSSLGPNITGAFISWTKVETGHQALCFQFELKNGAEQPSLEKLNQLHEEFIELLSQQQPEFRDDYEKFYRPFEKEGLRIFQFYFCESPELSDHPKYTSSIKRKVIVDEGPF